MQTCERMQYETILTSPVQLIITDFKLLSRESIVLPQKNCAFIATRVALIHLSDGKIEEYGVVMCLCAPAKKQIGGEMVVPKFHPESMVRFNVLPCIYNFA